MTTPAPILTDAVQRATIVRDFEAPHGAATMSTAWANTFRGRDHKTRSDQAR